MNYKRNETNDITPLLTMESGILGNKAAQILAVLNFVVFGSCIAALGISTNTINIVVFLKQGFTDSVNVSLFALSLSDLSSLLFFLWISLLMNPLFLNLGIPLLPLDFLHLTGAWPHAFFARTTSWITAYITLERCLCVLIPLKVKTVATPKLAISVLASVFLIHLMTLLPDYSTAYLDWKFDSAHNRSMLGLLFKDGRDQMVVLSFILAAYTQIISFLAVVLFTIILVIKMKQNSRWRAATANVGADSQKRDTRTVKMVILIAVIYSICYVPTMASYMATSVVPEYFFLGRFRNTFVVTWSFNFLADSINSSVNIFVYYRMSTKYRATYDHLFKRKPWNQLSITTE